MTSPLDALTHRFLTAAWWAVLARGLLAIAFGVLIFVWPTISLLTLILVYGAYAVVDGIFALIAAFRSHGQGRWSLSTGALASEGAAVAIAFRRPPPRSKSSWASQRLPFHNQ